MKTARSIDATWLREGALPRLLAVLDREGEEARVVGGAVRNALLGEPVGEVDIATTATPEEVVRRVSAAGFKAVPTGIEHGTVTVVIDGAPYEVTTLRQDIETDGRHAKVAFGRDWASDAQRRDFTMNALSATRDGTVYDYTGGVADIEARRLRFIGNASTRIAEDYLRILRFFRFHAAYGRGAPDAAALAACIAGRDGLDRLSRERVRQEMLKLLIAPGAAAALDAMMDAGLLVRVLASAPNVAQLRRMVGVEVALGLSPDAMRRLAALAVLVPEDADRLREKLRLANAEHEQLVSMGEGWWRVSSTLAEREIHALVYRLGAAQFTDQAMLGWSRSGDATDATDATDAAGWRGVVETARTWQRPNFPLSATDFMQRGVAKGPALGKALAVAEHDWIAQGFPGDAASLARIADAAARR